MNLLPGIVTKDQARHRSKTVERFPYRIKRGVGENLIARDENKQRVAVVQMVSIRREKLYRLIKDARNMQYGAQEMKKMNLNISPQDFVVNWCRAHSARPYAKITRVEWKFL